ncbi:MAG TPA: queuosine salvage family protein [Solirubrobacteraceae bacterium]|nr:queuosine salvage family protein [Solirubrobacteraceae bacterium]
MSDIPSLVRQACARVAERARYVTIERDAIAAYAAALPLRTPSPAPDPEAHLLEGTREERSAFWLTLDAINFGSGWFPTLRKREGRSGYYTVASGVRERIAAAGPWAAEELAVITPREVAQALGQDPGHELMALFASSLADLGRHVADEFKGRFLAVVEAADGSAPALAGLLARWEGFADVSRYDGFAVPFYKRAQIAAADLADGGVVRWRDADRLTMFADNLVPHVLRQDGILRFSRDLSDRIDGGELIEHGAPEEVEIRACALHAVELMVAARPGISALEVDRLLWGRGGGPAYKSRPRHRSRSTAY